MIRIIIVFLLSLWLPAAAAAESQIDLLPDGIYFSDFEAQKLNGVFNEMGYSQHINLPGNVYPRFFVQRFPADWAAYDKATERNLLFIKILTPLIYKINLEILEERADLEAIAGGLRQDHDLDPLLCQYVSEKAEKYDVHTAFEDSRRCMKLLNELLKRVDIVPPSILVAAAAIHTDWGTSRPALLGNNLYQMKNWYSDEGLVPTEEPEEPYRFKIYQSLEESIRDYVLKINSHINYAQFRDARATARHMAPIMYGKRLIWSFVLDNNLHNYAGLLDYTLTFYHLEHLDESELRPAYESEN